MKAHAHCIVTLRIKFLKNATKALPPDKNQWRALVCSQESAEKALTLAIEHDLGPWLSGQATMQRGWALLMQGHADEGMADLHNGFAVLQRIKAVSPWDFIQLLEAYKHRGQAETGLQLLEKTQNVYWQPHADYFRQLEAGEDVLVEVPNFYRLKGELLLALPSPDEQQAERCFHQALSLARRQGSKADELRTAIQLGHLWYKHGKRDAARELLAELYDWFSEGEHTGDLVEAKALLQAC